MHTHTNVENPAHPQELHSYLETVASKILSTYTIYCVSYYARKIHSYSCSTSVERGERSVTKSSDTGILKGFNTQTIKALSILLEIDRDSPISISPMAMYDAENRVSCREAVCSLIEIFSPFIFLLTILLLSNILFWCILKQLSLIFRRLLCCVLSMSVSFLHLNSTLR